MNTPGLEMEVLEMEQIYIYVNGLTVFKKSVVLLLSFG